MTNASFKQEIMTYEGKIEIKQLIKELISLKPEIREQFIENHLKQNNIDYSIQDFPNGRNIEVSKIIEGSKEVVFFSHYDISMDTSEGANDNASSVAVMLNVAKFLKNFKPYITVRIVFNDNEEILGALLNSKINMDIFKTSEIIHKAGSFQYLKNHPNINDILGVFNVELSGIGNSIYISSSSGSINCDKLLIDFSSMIAKTNKTNHIIIPFLFSDMISAHTLGIPGTVIGAIPGFEAEIYLEKYKQSKNNDFFPSTWNNIHSKRDNYFAIQEKSLNMTYNFIISIIKNLNLLLY